MLQNTSCWIGAWVVAEGIVVMRRIFLAMTGGGGARGGWPCLWLSVAGPLIWKSTRCTHIRNRVLGTIYLCTDTYGNWRAAYRAVATVIYSRWSSVYSGAPLR